MPDEFVRALDRARAQRLCMEARARAEQATNELIAALRKDVTGLDAQLRHMERVRVLSDRCEALDKAYFRALKRAYG